MESRLLWGMVETLILDVVSRGPNYGYQIARTVMGQSQGYFELKEGSLYPALHRLERQKLLSSFWENTSEGRRRKFYRLTPTGRKELKAKLQDWDAFCSGVNGVLKADYGLA